MRLGDEARTLGWIPLLELPRRIVHLREPVEVRRRAPEAAQSIARPHVGRRVEVVGGNMLPGNLQEVSGIKPGQRVVSNALVLQSTVEQ